MVKVLFLLGGGNGSDGGGTYASSDTTDITVIVDLA